MDHGSCIVAAAHSAMHFGDSLAFTESSLDQNFGRQNSGPAI